MNAGFKLIGFFGFIMKLSVFSQRNSNHEKLKYGETASQNFIKPIKFLKMRFCICFSLEIEEKYFAISSLVLPVRQIKLTSPRWPKLGTGFRGYPIQVLSVI